MHQHDPIDRVSPTLEPDEQVVMYQNWHHLGFLHWEVPYADLQALVPPQLTVDTFEGKAYIGLIPFTVTGIRPVGLPAVPGLSSMHEINVRTYVHHKGANPGVWFFSLDASSVLAVGAARAAYKLAYTHAKIDFAATEDPLPTVEMSVHRDDDRGPTPAHAHLSYRPAEGPVVHAAPGTLEHFLAERYILYSVDEQRRLHMARVHHQPYPLQRADVLALDETLIWSAGVKRSENIPLRHYAREVNVKIYPLRTVD